MVGHDPEGDGRAAEGAGRSRGADPEDGDSPVGEVVEREVAPASPVPGSADDRLLRLMEEFRRRQRQRPDLVVRPWWTPVENGAVGHQPPHGALGFVIEYCPRGRDTAELAVRRDRVRIEGTSGLREAGLGLSDGWLLEGEDRVCPETLANYLLRLADQLLDEEAA